MSYRKLVQSPFKTKKSKEIVPKRTSGILNPIGKSYSLIKGQLWTKNGLFLMEKGN